MICCSFIKILLGPCGGGLVSGQPSRIMMSGRTPPLTPLVGSSPADCSLPSPRSVSPASLTGCMVCLCFTLFLPSYFRQHPSGYGLRVRQSIYSAEAGYGQPYPCLAASIPDSLSEFLPRCVIQLSSLAFCKILPRCVMPDCVVFINVWMWAHRCHVVPVIGLIECIDHMFCPGV